MSSKGTSFESCFNILSLVHKTVIKFVCLCLPLLITNVPKCRDHGKWQQTINSSCEQPPHLFQKIVKNGKKGTHHTDDLNHVVKKDVEKQTLVREQAAWI